ncbi:hypothetical protein MJO29_003233 [Puccinia striiformis f. sp. tritici]|uniref:hypothetical protein n=1 Tax=Puccinia striiformis f. sp. tritici TaxID=168172 RepID=UPI0020080D5D|nr:hypothetical protein Pst134EA_004937 [Puccinia striiformis f. sp. tritici]KAH9471028.1 hypothetical protein Pst134EA_004937 [Puccinia striiformis f. sp. tritici]KAI7965135.1 hypothetical protein MJO29_003233 [Puccinia striiformis f. sp. tritici]
MSDSVAVANTSQALRVTDAPTNVTSTPGYHLPTATHESRLPVVAENVTSPEIQEIGSIDDEEITSILGMNNDVAPSELGDSPEQDTGSLPSVVFMIPLPAPLIGRRSKDTTPFLIYSPPRRIYERPQKNDEGKRPKEKLFKRVVRLYQKEVRKGEQLKRKEIPNEGKFRSVIKARGALVRGAHMMSNWLPSSCVETLARVPPKHKLGEILVLFPEFSGETRPEESEQPYQPSEEDLLHDLNVLLRKTKKGIVVRLVVVSALLPIAAGIDFFAPVFFVEISIAYLAFQVYGLRKVKALTSKKSKSKKSKASAAKAKAKSQQQVTDGTSAEAVEIRAEDSASNPTEDGPDSYFRVKAIDVATIEPVMKLLYNICTRIDPLCFPPPEGQEIDASERFETVPAEQGGSGIESTDPAVPAKTVLPPTLHRPAPEMVREMVRVFKENLSPEVVERYDLDEERLANDLARYLKKASVEYVTSLKGRPESGMIKRTSKWFSKRGVIKRERKDKRAVKKQIKTEVAQQIAADQAEADRILSENQQTSTPSDSTEPLTPKAEKKLKKQLQKEEKILKKSQKASTNKKGKNPEVVA